MGLFAEWAPQYAERGIPTFPVAFRDGDKVPGVKGYARVGLDVSRRLVGRFGSADAFGFMVRKARVTILDVDSKDDRELTRALDRHGETPLVVRTASGGAHCYYKHNGEKRQIRPWGAKRPVDLLGDGFALGLPSKGARGWYTPIQGTLDDLAHLPTLRGLEDLQAAPVERVLEGQRNQSLFAFTLREALLCASHAELLARASAYAEAAFVPPLPAWRVERTVQSAWGMTERGENWGGAGGMAALSHDVIDRYTGNDTDALALLLKLKRHHWGRSAFVLSKAMAESMGWDNRRFLRARARLEADGELICVDRGGRGPGTPPQFRWPEAPLLRGTKMLHNEKYTPPLSLGPLPLTASERGC